MAHDDYSSLPWYVGSWYKLLSFILCLVIFVFSFVPFTDQFLHANIFRHFRLMRGLRSWTVCSLAYQVLWLARISYLTATKVYKHLGKWIRWYTSHMSLVKLVLKCVSLSQTIHSILLDLVSHEVILEVIKRDGILGQSKDWRGLLFNGGNGLFLRCNCHTGVLWVEGSWYVRDGTYLLDGALSNVLFSHESVVDTVLSRFLLKLLFLTSS